MTTLLFALACVSAVLAGICFAKAWDLDRPADQQRLSWLPDDHHDFWRRR